MTEGTSPPQEQKGFGYRYSFFVENHIYAREELFFRLKERSRFFYMHLFIQGVLLALAFGFQFGEFKAPGVTSQGFLTFPFVLILSVPAAFIIANLYIIEDYLVDFASRHLAYLSKLEQQICGSSVSIPNFDYAMGPAFTRITIPLRFQTQIIGFVIIPMIIVSFRFYNIGFPHLKYYYWIEMAVYLALIATICFRLIALYRYRHVSVTPSNSYDKSDNPSKLTT
jgi:hypothetical protein